MRIVMCTVTFWAKTPPAIVLRTHRIDIQPPYCGLKWYRGRRGIKKKGFYVLDKAYKSKKPRKDCGLSFKFQYRDRGALQNLKLI